jgi:hypothetical protein
MQRSGMKTTRGANRPYALPLSPSYSELQRRIEVISAGVSAELDDSARLLTAPLTQSTAWGLLTVVSISVGKAGLGCQQRLRCLGTVLTAIERSDAERVSPFDSMLVSPRRSRGHAAAFASQQRRS